MTYNKQIEMNCARRSAVWYQVQCNYCGVVLAYHATASPLMHNLRNEQPNVNYRETSLSGGFQQQTIQDTLALK